MVSGVDNSYKRGERSHILHSLECSRCLPRRDDLTPAMCRVHHDDGAVLLVPNIIRNTFLATAALATYRKSPIPGDSK
jgi:hypothetical protein